MQKYALIFFVFISSFSRASHNRSGEITYKRIPPYTKISGGLTVQAYWYAITVVKYTDDDTQLLTSSSSNQVLDRCVDSLYFGDGTKDATERSNGGTPVCIGCKPCDCGNCGELLIKEPGYRVKKNIYRFVHEYPGPGSYTMRTSDPNRNEGVHNMNNSDQQLFYLESLLVINSFTDPNNSPVFTVDPIDKACLGKCFTHNPGAYDAEHDSLSFKLSTPKRANGITVAGYFDPETQPGGTFNINARSGILTWCSPIVVGEYNVAFVVQEWRKTTSDTYQLVGTVLRDMQILVRSCPNNDPPVILVPQDTCVEAGTLVEKKIRVSDPNATNVVNLSGSGGAFSAAPPATLSNASGNGINAEFKWQTSCEHIAKQYYQTTFRAEDNAGSFKLVTYNVYNIRVVPPSVKNVTAAPLGSNMQISWSLSNCKPLANPLTAYKIYRAEGCIPFKNEPCKTGVASSSGFVFIGQTTNAVSSFIDTNDGEGLVVGQNYSYLVIASYNDGSESYGSAAVCAKLKRDVPVLLNVDVVSTGSDGVIKIRWSRPLKTEGNLDTLAIIGPYRFDLKFKEKGLFKTIFTSTANYLYLLDTAFTHEPVNTTLDSNHYYVEFTAKQNLIVGSSQKATSVFLSAVGSDRKVELNWKGKTPWKNYKYTVFRKAPGSTVFTAIGTTTATTFSDKNAVANKKTYCYYVLTEGEYSDPAIYKPLLNKSQEVCITPVDLTPPCTPTLTIDADCPTGFVTVHWKNVRPLCGDDAISYVLFYKNTVDDSYEKLFETDTTYYIYDGLSFSGCYAIQAVDSAGNLSALSPDFCIDNCPEFELPNIFSPNKDGANDFFKAIKVRQVKEIDLVVVDRWGNLMYKTKDPYFQWNGINSQSGQAASEGTFFYVCTVYEPRVKGVVKRVLKGTVQVVR